ncbi:hypothetical protein ACKWTF_014209 [Chironomus riparius]
MKLNLISIIFGLIFLICASNCIDPDVLICHKTTKEFDNVGNFTYCKVTTAVRIDKQNFPVAIGTNDAFDGVGFKNQKISYVPSLVPIKLAEIIRILIVKHSTLKQITSNDLKIYKSLEVLDLSDNHLIYLEKDLLQHNLKLKYFDISSNQIIAIHSTVFESLLNLSYLNILYNKCASQNTFANQHAIKNGMTKLKTLCMNDCFLQLSQANKTIEKEKSEKFRLSIEVKELRTKMISLQAITIITLCFVIAALILYIIRKNCQKSSSQRFHSKVTEKIDMFEETSSIFFSSTVGGLDDYPVRLNASNLNIMNENQSINAEDELPENVYSEYADPILFTKEDIHKRQQNTTNYQNSEVNPSHQAPNYINCGQLSDGSDVKYQNYPFGLSTHDLVELGDSSTLNIQDVGKGVQNGGQGSAEYANFFKGIALAESDGQAKIGTIYENYPQTVSQKPSEAVTSSKTLMTQSINDLSPSKQPESLNISSSYDSSTQRSIKTGEIGKKTVIYTNISQSKSQTDQDSKISQPQVPKIQIDSTQSSTESFKRPKNIPNLQKSSFMKNLNEKLNVVTPKDNNTFDFPAINGSLPKSKNKKSPKMYFRSARSRQVPIKSPGSVSWDQPSFTFDQQSPSLPGSINMSSESPQTSPIVPDLIQNNSNSGTLKSTTTFQLNLKDSKNHKVQKSSSSNVSKIPEDENAPELPNRNNATLPKIRESINVDYCEPLANSDVQELYSEPYSPDKV